LRDQGYDVKEDQSLTRGKMAIIRLFESMNGKYSELSKKDETHMINFTSSKYSQMSANIKKDIGMTLSEMMTMIQTNLLKMYIEGGLKEKIHDFFKRWHHSCFYVDHAELTTYIDSGDQSEVSSIAMALLHEACGEKEKALKIWEFLKTQEAANKTVELLFEVKEDTDFMRRLIKTYLKWVLE
jgi:hypothetical protein